MPDNDDLIRNAEAYAAGFDRGRLERPPRRRLAVVTCMDARINLFLLLGLREGDAHIIRNAGGVITDGEIRSLAISQRLMGTREIILIHHTDCGMQAFNDREFRAELEAETGVPAPWDTGTFEDLDLDVLKSIARVRESPFIPHSDKVRGFVYEVETGVLREVAQATA
ncbi:MAG TPA: carbonic anhydrase [Solirubrobacteraceae bacterium]|nr:carbonic anhydrase [Solirubrobacteraceae bacterium]